jgi:YesN/AraC family two-component response regulator
MAAGMDNYLSKPINKAELLGLLQLYGTGWPSERVETASVGP